MSSDKNRSLSNDGQELGCVRKVRLHELYNLCELFAAEESEDTVTKIRQWIDENRSDDKFFKEAAGYNLDGLTPLHLLCMSSNAPLDVSTDVDSACTRNITN